MNDRRVSSKLRRDAPRARTESRRPSVVPVAALLMAATLLAACGGEVRTAFGLDRAVPDEFAVVPRAPLTLPPDFALRPPAPGAARPQEEDTRAVARRTVIGGVETSLELPAGSGGGERQLLRSAGADQAMPDIRQLVERESADLLLAEESFVNQLLNWQEDRVLGRVVDPQAEAERLASNAAVGDPLNQGDVPTIERRGRAPLVVLLEQIF